jgi:hypothetical protein
LQNSNGVNYGVIGGRIGNILTHPQFDIGDFSTIGGGEGNVSSGYNNFIGGGNANSVEAIFATIGGGNVNYAGAVQAVVAGGGGNTNGGDSCFSGETDPIQPSLRALSNYQCGPTVETVGYCRMSLRDKSFSTLAFIVLLTGRTEVHGEGERGILQRRKRKAEPASGLSLLCVTRY